MLNQSQEILMLIGDYWLPISGYLFKCKLKTSSFDRNQSKACVSNYRFDVPRYQVLLIIANIASIFTAVQSGQFASQDAKNSGRIKFFWTSSMHILGPKKLVEENFLTKLFNILAKKHLRFTVMWRKILFQVLNYQDVFVPFTTEKQVVWYFNIEYFSNCKPYQEFSLLAREGAKRNELKINPAWNIFADLRKKSGKHFVNLHKPEYKISGHNRFSKFFFI